MLCMLCDVCMCVHVCECVFCLDSIVVEFISTLVACHMRSTVLIVVSNRPKKLTELVVSC